MKGRGVKLPIVPLGAVEIFVEDAAEPEIAASWMRIARSRDGTRWIRRLGWVMTAETWGRLKAHTQPEPDLAGLERSTYRGDVPPMRY